MFLGAHPVGLLSAARTYAHSHHIHTHIATQP